MEKPVPAVARDPCLAFLVWLPPGLESVVQLRCQLALTFPFPELRSISQQETSSSLTWESNADPKPLTNQKCEHRNQALLLRWFA